MSTHQMVWILLPYGKKDHKGLCGLPDLLGSLSESSNALLFRIRHGSRQDITSGAGKNI